MSTLADRVAKHITDMARRMGNGDVEVGFMEDATYPDGTPVAEAAVNNEFGHGGQFPAPPRPFFRTMIAKEKPTWGTKVANLAKTTDYDGPKLLAIMGEDIDGALKESIATLTEPELSPTTLMLRKKFKNDPQNIRARDVIAAQKAVADGEEGATGTQAKPLVWTGHMLNSTAYRVDKGDSMQLNTETGEYEAR